MDMNKYDAILKKCFLCVLKYLVISIHDNLGKNQPIIQMQYLINSHLLQYFQLRYNLGGD